MELRREGHLFAPVAIAGTWFTPATCVARSRDRLKGGQEQWILDLGKAPEVQAPGMVYGGPIVQAADSMSRPVTCKVRTRGKILRS